MGNCLGGGSKNEKEEEYGLPTDISVLNRRLGSKPGSRPPSHFSRINSFPASSFQHLNIQGSMNEQLMFKVPDNCTVLSTDEDIRLIDLIEKNPRGPDTWRTNINAEGIVLCKVVLPVEHRDPGYVPTEDEENEDNIEDMELFETELEILSSLKPHNHIMQFFGYQEKYENKCLHRRIFVEFCVDNVHTFVNHRTMGGKKPLPAIEIALIAFHMSKGLEYLHSNNIVNRNVSSDNVVLTYDVLDDKRRHWLQNLAMDPLGNQLDNNGNTTKKEKEENLSGRRPRGEARKEGAYIRYLYSFPITARISNFTESKRLDSGQRASTLVGNVQYMCPEMFKQEAYSFGCDIWSFGAVVYEMLTAKRPFDKKNNYAYVESRVTGGKFPPKERLSNKSLEYLEDVMRQCLQAEPSARANAAELVKQLTNYSPRS